MNRQNHITLGSLRYSTIILPLYTAHNVHNEKSHTWHTYRQTHAHAKVYRMTDHDNYYTTHKPVQYNTSNTVNWRPPCKNQIHHTFCSCRSCHQWIRRIKTHRSWKYCTRRPRNRPVARGGSDRSDDPPPPKCDQVRFLRSTFLSVSEWFH